MIIDYGNYCIQYVGSAPCEDCDYRTKCEQKCEDGQKWEDEYLKTLNGLKELYETLDSKG